jgi:hypothetical protein
LVPFKQNGVKTGPRLISWSEYGKTLSADIRFSFNTKSRDTYYSYKTRNGDQFQIELVEKSPIVVQGNGKVCSQGYMAKFRIPKLTLTRFWSGHYTPTYTADYIEAENIEFYVLLK